MCRTGGCRRRRLLEDEPEEGKYIGANVRRLDAPSKVSGALKYAGDMTMPGMLHMQVLRSPHRACGHRIDRHQRSRGDDRRRRRHHLCRCAGRGRLRRVRARPAGDGARQGALCRRSGGGGRVRRSGDREARALEDQGAIQAAARGVRSARGHEAGRAVAARLCAGQCHQAHSDPQRRRRGGLCAIRSRGRAGLRYPGDRACLSRAGGGAWLCRSRWRGDDRVAEPEHHASSPHAGEDHRKADQQGTLHHVAGRRRLWRQGRHDLSGHAGPDDDEDRSPGAACFHARGIDRDHGEAASLAHDVADGADPRWPHPGGVAEDDLRRRRLWAFDRRRDAQGRDPRRRALQHSKSSGRYLSASTPTTRRPAPSVPSARCRRSSRPNPISTSAPNGLDSIRSKSAASMRCAMARRRIPSSNSNR